MHTCTQRQKEKKKNINSIKEGNFFLRGLRKYSRFSFRFLSVTHKFIVNYSELGVNLICFLVPLFLTCSEK